VSLEAVQLAGMFGLVALLLLTRPLHGVDAGRVLLVDCRRVTISIGKASLWHAVSCGAADTYRRRTR
jgi:hypothetical protein